MSLLPVSGLEPALPQPTGADELVLWEAPGSPVARSIAFLSTLSDACDWAALPVTDFEILLLRLRERVMGDLCELGFHCPHCAARVEVTFRVRDFLADIQPQRPAGVELVAGRAGWFDCQGVAFRLPTAGDQVAVEGRPDAVQLLVERCIDIANPPARLRARIERAMAALAPEVSRELVGSCPDCGKTAVAMLYVTQLVVAEFAREAARLYDEVDLIARAYHWREAEILHMPRRRRRAYAERIRQAA